MMGIVCGPYLPVELLDSYRIQPQTKDGLRLKKEREARQKSETVPLQGGVSLRGGQ